MPNSLDSVSPGLNSDNSFVTSIINKIIMSITRTEVLEGLMLEDSGTRAQLQNGV